MFEEKNIVHKTYCRYDEKTCYKVFRQCVGTPEKVGYKGEGNYEAHTCYSGLPMGTSATRVVMQTIHFGDP